MFPVKDDIPTDRVPIVTMALIAANVVVLLIADAGLLLTLVNAGFLWLFGPSVEDALGRARFVAFVGASGLIAAGIQLVVDPDASAVVAGSCGAIAAMIGAYLRLYPWAHMQAIVLAPFFFTIVAIPVMAMIGGWVVVQVGLALLDPADVPYGALAAGVAIGLLAARRVATNVKTPDGLLRRGRAVLS